MNSEKFIKDLTMLLHLSKYYSYDSEYKNHIDNINKLKKILKSKKYDKLFKDK